MPKKYDNEMSGVLFSAEKKNESQPDFTGKATINGVEYRVAAWQRVSQRGQDYFSLAFSIPREKESHKSLYNDDLPF